MGVSRTTVFKFLLFKKIFTKSVNLLNDCSNFFFFYSSPHALVEFVQIQLQDPIKEFKQSSDVKFLDTKKRMIIAHFDHKDTAEYRIYRRVAVNLREDCDFFASFDGKIPTGGLHSTFGI